MLESGSRSDGPGFPRLINRFWRRVGSAGATGTDHRPARTSNSAADHVALWVSIRVRFAFTPVAGLAGIRYRLA